MLDRERGEMQKLLGKSIEFRCGQCLRLIASVDYSNHVNNGDCKPIMTEKEL
jgi:hypothetical protein